MFYLLAPVSLSPLINIRKYLREF
jgi:hypothetical protein